ncbi:AAA family ATPase, partial [Burkholderia sp. SIMBA_024]|uniref:AAA family ATPase n=1 Tax=Burkholderia sp. SIMBA_024 TaxID=3085768 RepID=UPI00397D8129
VETGGGLRVHPDTARAIGGGRGNGWMRFNGNRDVTQMDFIGQWVARNGSTVFEHGPLPLAMKEGRVLILDEFDHMPAECSSIMHSVMEPGGKLVISTNGGEVITPHPNFRIVATANTIGHGDEHGQHPAAQVQDAAMRSRFDLI